MKRALAASFFCILAATACRAQISAEGALFYERGHYWIELAFRNEAGRDTIPQHLVPAAFEIAKVGDAAGAFKPSRVEVVTFEGGGSAVILSSGKLEGRACYRVTCKPEGFEPVVIDSICDPFVFAPGASECGGKALFRKYAASAFQKDGDAYTLNQFKYEYDFSDERSSSSLCIEPRFKTHGVAFEPSFEQGAVAYVLGRTGTTSTDKRSFGFSVSTAAWAQDLRFGISGGYRHDRSVFQGTAGNSVIYTQSLTVEGRIRFDNLFDRVNRYCLSAFKGVDLGFGYAWYQSDEGNMWGSSDFGRTTPFVNPRATWTFLYGFQLSYSLCSCWPTSGDDEFTEFHSLRFRLLLRDVLPAQAGKAYHPDIEFAFDTGKRLPLFEQEKKVSIGFTFGLYPW
jgi:hypothetical protein